MSLETISSNKVFGGVLQRFKHQSVSTSTSMTCALYLPPQAAADKQQSSDVPVMYWLSGLTCTDENFMQKAGALRMASELGIAIVAPDTSPRGEGVCDDENKSYDLGLGAGFYLNATQDPWQQHYQMYDYIVKELPGFIESNFPVSARRCISGHSMGGHGALTIGLKNPTLYRSISAFSPIVNPTQCPWGEKAFAAYLGSNKEAWKEYDSCDLIEGSNTEHQLPILIDQGDADDFLEEQLRPGNFIHAAKKSEYPIQLRMQQGYDHSYYFISSYIEDHLHFHAKYLQT